MKVVLASGNAGKVREFAALLAARGLTVLPQTAFGISPPEETGASFLDNALIKARHAAERSGLPAIADDSGIEVDALGGRPGVRSARYAGENAGDAENIARLLQEMTGVPEAARTARFRCVLVFVRDGADPAPLVAEGLWEGHVLTSPRGAGGFGYDPVFQPDGFPGSAAEMSAADKNRASHRAQALRALMAALP
ncbi:MAG TPA: RdgB/HAM1 family non-canonical purine NTP pyrophosphatase [Steroidobacteraceae bacterium]|nr:RdgB/HAM1 family non-canonical purine NTP pyrophosphatase [Steroidobacteraceae bacterium]